jgi:hypothetical protein
MSAACSRESCVRWIWHSSDARDLRLASRESGFRRIEQKEEELSLFLSPVFCGGCCCDAHWLRLEVRSVCDGVDQAEFAAPSDIDPDLGRPRSPWAVLGSVLPDNFAAFLPLA